jgi:hypothetical protein
MANVIYCQHCGDAPLLTHPTIIRIRQEAFEQRLKAELGDRYLTREQAAARYKELQRKRRRRRPEPPFDVYEEAM